MSSSRTRKHINELAKLRADCEKIGTQLDMPPLPIKRSMEQVAETSRRLAAKTTGAEQVAAKNKGKYLLAKKVDVVELDRLKDIEIKTAFAPQEPLKEDIEGFLSHHNDVIILSAIEEAKRETENRYKSNFVNSLERDWEDTKKSILDSIGSLQSFAATKEFDPKKTTEYARLISEYARRSDITLLALLDYMIRISQSLDARNAPLNNCWNLLKILLDSSSNTSKKRALVERSKSFLELQFREYIKKLVRQNPQVAELGGEPSLLSQIQAYIRIINLQGSLVWPQIYYLMRCGDREEARELARRNNIDLARQKDIRPTNDPYHDAVVSILNYRSSSTPKVVRAWEDFMWFKLETLPESDEGVEAGLKQIQQAFDQAPPSHYNKGKNPLAFLQILLLSQQFSRAIQYFYSETHYQVEAVHFAIVLYLAGLLSADNKTPDLMFGKETPAVNFDKLMQYYAPKTSDPLSYYFIIREREPEKFKASIKKHIIDTKEYSFLRDERTEEDLRKQFQEIAQQAALSLEERGMDEDAFDLYLLAKKYNRVLLILNRQLGKVISMTGQSAEREQWLFAANKFQNEIDPAAIAFLEKEREFRVYEKLRRLQLFFDLVFKSDWLAALEALRSVDVVPKTSAEVSEKLQNYKSLDDSIRNNIEAILSANMDVLVNTSRILRPHADVNERQLQNNLEWAKALIKFSASLPGGIARDVNPKLVLSMRELETGTSGFFGWK